MCVSYELTWCIRQPRDRCDSLLFHTINFQMKLELELKHICCVSDIPCEIRREILEHWMAFLRCCCNLCAMSLHAFNSVRIHRSLPVRYALLSQRIARKHSNKIWNACVPLIFHVAEKNEKKTSSNSRRTKSLSDWPAFARRDNSIGIHAFEYSYNLHILRIQLVRRGAIAINTCAETCIGPYQQTPF